jgi:hypothetical protein
MTFLSAGTALFSVKPSTTAPNQVLQSVAQTYGVQARRSRRVVDQEPQAEDPNKKLSPKYMVRVEC